MNDKPASESAEVVTSKGIGSSALLASDVFSAFKTYSDARERQVVLEGRRRKGSFRISVDKDEEAVEWQSLSRPIEESRAFLEGRPPIPECWGGRSALANVAISQPDAKPTNT